MAGSHGNSVVNVFRSRCYRFAQAFLPARAFHVLGSTPPSRCVWGVSFTPVSKLQEPPPPRRSIPLSPRDCSQAHQMGKPRL